MHQVAWGQSRIQRFVIADDWCFVAKAFFAQQAAHELAIFELLALRPSFRLEVAEHQELGKGEEPQRHFVAPHAPARLIGNELFDLGEVRGNVEFLCLGEVGQLEVEFELELFLQ